MIREIVKDTFFLSQKSEPATKQDQQVIQDLLDTIHAHADHCVGMAANMIGVRKTVLVAQIGATYQILINPVIVEQSDHLVPFSEGCLSIPGISCEIERPDHVVVEAYDLDANLIRYEATGDLFCVCLQHEIDHLHGNTMFERLKPMQRLKAVKEYQDALARGARPGETE